MTKTIFMISGPNGAGKTTIAKSFIQDQTVDEFINADEIARGLAPLRPESVSIAASKLLLSRFEELLKAKQSFAFETTGAAKTYIKRLKEAQQFGYEIYLVFLWLPSPDLAIERVANRVKQGGHNIDEKTIRNRYFSGLKNIVSFYLPLANRVLIVDNSVTEKNVIIAKKHTDGTLTIEKPKIWKEIQEVVYGKQI